MADRNEPAHRRQRPAARIAHFTFGVLFILAGLSGLVGDDGGSGPETERIADID